MSPKHILIISDPQDLHARAVGYAIRMKGHECEELYSHDFPTQTDITFRLSSRLHQNSGTVRQINSGFNITNHDFDTIWLRRRHSSWLPDFMHPGDRDVAVRQADRVLSDVLAAL